MPTALLSVYHKNGIVEFAQALIALGWDILASGGTAKHLANAGVAVRNVAELVGGNAILGHRVVTLSREVHAGLLARNIPDDEQEMKGLNLPFIDLVCVDLYPLIQEINRSGSNLDSVIELTDIGGPTMLRSAAKGNRIVICDPADRQSVIQWLQAAQPNNNEFINHLAAKAEFIVAQYCLASANYRGDGQYTGLIGKKALGCCYGENRWQSPAALFTSQTDDPLALDRFEVMEGSAPSYVNLCDVDRLLQTITHIAAAFDLNRKKVPYIAVGCKHGNPCGAAFGDNPNDVIDKMVNGDPLAIFGGIVMTNFSITHETATTLLGNESKKRLFDGVVAPFFSPRAREALKRKNDRCRLYQNPELGSINLGSLNQNPIIRPVRGGFLLQPNYTFVLDLNDERLVKSSNLSVSAENDLLLAWAVGSTSNSNTITLVRNGMLTGNGVGQQDRVGGCELAIHRALRSRHVMEGAVAYSDSFFPFTDGPELLANAAVKTIFSTSGSVNDQKVRDFCAERSVNLWMIPDAVGRGFYSH